MNNPSILRGSVNPSDRLFVRQTWQRLLCSSLSALVAGFSGASVLAANIQKANNADALNLSSSWVGGVVPGASDTAVWDSTVTGPNDTVLGASAAWLGIKIANPGGPVQISADGNTLTNGAVAVVGNVGIDMSGASQNLTLSNNVVIDGVQDWNIASGRTLTLGGNLARNSGGVINFNLADSSSIVIITNGSSAVSQTVNVPNALLGSTYGWNYFATVNGVDFAAEVDAAGGFQIVQGSSIAGLYASNPSGATPSDGGNINIMDFNNTGSSGVRLANTRTYNAMRFDTQQAATDVTYQGVPAWQVWIPSGRTLTMNNILVAPSEGNTPILFNNGAQSGGTVGHVRISTGGAQNLLIYQNNPGAPLIFQPNVNIVQQGTGSLVKMGVGTVQIQNASTYTGGTRIYGGTIELDGTGSVGSGPLSVFAGNFAQSSGGVNAAATTVSSGATNSLLINTANGQVADNSNLTFNAATRLRLVYGSGLAPGASPALIVTNASNGLAASGTVTIDVLSGNLAVGQYPLIQYAGTVGGDGGSAFTLGLIEPHASGFISNNTANSTIDLVVTTITQPLTWAAGNAVWDTTTSNWKDTLGGTTTYQQIETLGDNVIFDDSTPGTSPITVTLNSTLTPGSVTVDNTNKDYVISGSGDIAGIASVTKLGAGTLTLSTANSFSGGLNLNGGILNFSSLGNLGAGAITFDGGTLQYASGNVDDISTRTVTFNAGGGTIDDGGNTLTFANPIGNTGSGGFTKAGTGTLTLNGVNTYSGNTIVSQGTLALAVSGSLANSAQIVVNSGATLDTATSAVGLALNGSVNQVLAGTGAVTGEVTNGLNTSISPAGSGVYGTLTAGSDLVVDGGTLAVDISSSSRDLVAVSGNLSLLGGTLQLNVSGSLPNGTYKLIQYGGSLLSGPGSSGNLLLAGFSEAGKTAYLIDSTPGEVDLVIGTSASDNLTWSGTAGGTWDLANSLNWLNGANPWAFTNGDLVTFNDSGAPTVTLDTSVRPSSVTVNATQNYTFADGTGSGGGKISGAGSLTKSGSGTLVIQTANDYTGPTTINAGTVQVGNGGIGDIGSGNITNNGALVFAQGDSAVHKVAGAISGTGSLTVNGATTVALQKDNSYSGATTISAGTLQVGNGGAGGSLGTAASVTDNGTLAVNRSGAFTLPQNISGSGSLVNLGSGVVTLGGSLTYQGDTTVGAGTVKVTTAGQLPNADNVVGSTGLLNVSGGTFDLNGSSQIVNGLSDLGASSGLIVNSGPAGTATLTIGIPSITNNTTYSGRINDNGSSKVQLVINSPGNQLLDCPTNTYSGGTIVGQGTLTLGLSTAQNGTAAAGVGSITMSNNTMLVIGHSTFPTNPIVIAPHSTVTFGSTSLGSSISGLVYGDAASTNIIVDIGNQGISAGAPGTWNNFPGTVLIADGGELRLFATPGGGTNTTFDIQGTGQLHTRTTEYFFLGALVGNGNVTSPQSGGTGNIVVGSKNVDCAFEGNISGNNNLYKTGTGRFIIDGQTNLVFGLDNQGNTTTNFVLTNFVSYVGATTVSNGVLALIAPNNFNSTNFTAFNLAGDSAVLDLSSAGYSPDGTNLVTNSTLTLGSSQTLTGIGTIMGGLNAGSGSTVTVGLPEGALNVTDGAELGGAVVMNVDATNTPNSSELVSSSFVIDSTATLTVNNLGPETGATFQLFNHPVNFSSVTLPALTGTNSWINNLNVDGSITLVAPPLVNTTPTNIVVSVGGGNLTLQWPPDHTGWRLQSQTNTTAVGLSTNWVDVAGANTTNQVTFPLGSTNGAVFFRMVYP